MKSYSSRELISMIVADGWELDRTVGSHRHYRHPSKPGTVTIPHPKKDVPLKTAKSIATQAGIELE